MLSTKTKSYSNYLASIQNKRWKTLLWFFNPYRWHIKKIINGKTLEIGCGIGRVLEFSSDQIIGVDHNKKSIELCTKKGLNAKNTVDFFETFRNTKPFHTILLSHVLEHMTIKEARSLITSYKPFLKKGGKLILITPQQKGYKTDPTHIEYMDVKKLISISISNGFTINKIYSFPFPKFMGKFFVYNEHVLICTNG